MKSRYRSRSRDEPLKLKPKSQNINALSHHRAIEVLEEQMIGFDAEMKDII